MNKRKPPLELFCNASAERYSYAGDREAIDALIAWLLDRHYWLEASYHINSLMVECGCSPSEIGKAIRLKINSNDARLSFVPGNSLGSTQARR